MQLSRLDIIGFGKFTNKSLEFKDGINIVYGENESGKTTIHNFIDGMFYGFIKPNIKSTRYFEEHKLYEPWNKNRYAGIISFIHNDESYRIEREFTKSNEETKVFLESTGQDITDKIDTGNKSRVLQPGYHFFGFNSNVFRNTISIRQLKTKTEKELSKEIKEKLINASQSMDEKISVKEAIKSLDEDLKKIGSSRAPTSPYARTGDHINRLKEKINDLKTKKDQYNDLLIESDRLEKQIINYKSKLQEKKEELEDIKYLELQKTYKRGLEGKEEIQELEEELNKAQAYRDISEEDFNEANGSLRQVSIIENNLDHYKKDQVKSEIRIDQLKLELEETISIYQSKFNSYNKKRNYSIIAMAASLLLFIILVNSLDTFTAPGLALGIIFIISLIAFFNFSIKTNHAKYGKGKSDKIIKDIEFYQNDLEDIKREVNSLNKDRERNVSRISYLLKENKVSNMDEFQEAVEGKRNYWRISSSLEDKRELYDNIMKGYSLEGLEEILASYKPKNRLDISSKDLILEEIDSLEEEISNIKLDMTRNQENIKHTEKYLDSLVLLEEELSDKEALIEGMDREIAAIELAKTTIEDLSKDIHEGFAPQINDRVSKIIGAITKGKYNRIKVDDKLGLGIINPESNEILKDKSLSGGTIDQVYFSLRCGLIGSISNDNLPLILDDCFIQYDDFRLKNVLELIGQLGKERQIIIFTCHTREKRFLSDLGIGYNLIEL